MRSVENVPLASVTTLGLGGPAAKLVLCDREEEILELVREADAARDPILVVGGGSNLVIADEGFPGTVLRMATRGFEETREGDRVTWTVAAGESWDDLVARAVAQNLAGVECLAGIPGRVGAVPMQNVGAYGQDVSETIVRVRTWDRDQGRVRTWDQGACQFAYRTSIFRGGDRQIILDVSFTLDADPLSRPIRYAELARGMGLKEGDRAPLGSVRETIIALRRKKGMVLDRADRDTASAGSFFTNPILAPAALAALEARLGDAPLPKFPEPDGRTKVSAAWLIERAGFAKGHAIGPVAISSKHALALTNRGGATTADLLVLARAVRDRVRDQFGVTLENEPVFVGVTL